MPKSFHVIKVINYPSIINIKYFSLLIIVEFYEESFSLVYDLTSKAITPDMWQMFELIYQVIFYFYISIFN